jgi:hypothetical protein
LTESPVKVTVPVAEKASYRHDKMVEISQKINEEELIIEFLEKTEKTFTSMTYDISNIIKVIQIETL